VPNAHQQQSPARESDSENPGDGNDVADFSTTVDWRLSPEAKKLRAGKSAAACGVRKSEKAEASSAVKVALLLRLSVVLTA